MARPEALPGVGVEVLIKENELAPVGIGTKLWHAPVYRTMSLFVPQKDACQPPRDFRSNFGERKHFARTRREFYFEGIAKIMMELLQRFD